MKFKTMAIISGTVLQNNRNGMVLQPDFDKTSKVHVMYPARFSEGYALICAGDEIIVSGEITLYNARNITIIPGALHDIQRKYPGNARTVNFVSITGQSKSVSYSLHTDDLFHAEFGYGILGTQKIDFHIDREKLNPESLRDFALGNQFRPYTISGKLQRFQSSDVNKLQLVADSIVRA